MFFPWNLSQRSNDIALDNAREAAVALSRLRVEREEIELYLVRAAERYAARHPA